MRTNTEVEMPQRCAATLKCVSIVLFALPMIILLAARRTHDYCMQPRERLLHFAIQSLTHSGAYQQMSMLLSYLNGFARMTRSQACSERKRRCSPI